MIHLWIWPSLFVPHREIVFESGDLAVGCTCGRSVLRFWSCLCWFSTGASGYCYRTVWSALEMHTTAKINVTSNVCVVFMYYLFWSCILINKIVIMFKSESMLYLKLCWTSLSPSLDLVYWSKLILFVFSNLFRHRLELVRTLSWPALDLTSNCFKTG